MRDNITFHLLMDVGNFYAKEGIQNRRYTDQTLGFWVTVKKLSKGKGINSFRGFKNQGSRIKENENMSLKEFRIHFVFYFVIGSFPPFSKVTFVSNMAGVLQETGPADPSGESKSRPFFFEVRVSHFF